MARKPPTDPRVDTLAAECGVTPISFSSPIPPLTWCHYCGFLATSRDHIVPNSVGGVDAWWNLAPSCNQCNVAKADRQECSCLFCLRAMALWHLGFRRDGKTRAEKRRLKKLKELS